MTVLTRAMPVWMTLDQTTRLALLDLGTLFHRGIGAPVPVQLWNSPRHPEAPAMTAVELRARALDAYGASLLEAEALWVWQDGWSSLSTAVPLADVAADALLPLWFQLRLPVEAEWAPLSGRVLLELELTWG